MVIDQVINIRELQQRILFSSARHKQTLTTQQLCSTVKTLISSVSQLSSLNHLKLENFPNQLNLSKSKLKMKSFTLREISSIIISNTRPCLVNKTDPQPTL